MGDENRPINSCIGIKKADRRIRVLVTSTSGFKLKNRSSAVSSYNIMSVLGIGAFLLLLRIIVYLFAFVIMYKAGAL